LYVLKTRGIKNSNQVREFVMTSKGLNLIEAYTGPEGGIFTGTPRIAQEAKDKASALLREQGLQQKRRDLRRKRLMFEAEMSLLKSRYEAEEDELQRAIAQGALREEGFARDRRDLATARFADQKSIGKHDVRKRR
jgi:circadian clock protein KaiC